jgi:hypothetical protein
VGVRFSNKLDEKTNRSIADYIYGKEESVKNFFSTDAPEDCKKENTFKECFIELRRVPLALL